MATLSFQQQPELNEIFEDSSRMLICILSEHSASVVLWNIPRNMAEACEIFTHIEDWEEDWEKIKGLSAMLSWKHLKTRILWDYPRFIPIPMPLFQPASAQAQLSLLHGAATHVHHGADVHAGAEMVIYWEVPEKLQRVIAAHFAHWQPSSMASVLAACTPRFEGFTASAHVILTGQCCWMVLVAAEKLLWIKRLPTQQPDEIIYSLLNACALHSIQQDDMVVLTAGPMEENSEMRQALQAYFHIDAAANKLTSEHKAQQYFGYLNVWLALGAATG